jgi:hypothetical protein
MWMQVQDHTSRSTDEVKVVKGEKMLEEWRL